MKTKIYTVKDKANLLFAMADILKNPLEYTDCTIEINNINVQLLAKVLSHTNSFVKFHYKQDEKLIRYVKIIQDTLSRVRSASSECDKLEQYDEPYAWDRLNKLIYQWNSSSGWTSTDNDGWNYLGGRKDYEFKAYKFTIEPAYDANIVTKLLGNRISIIDDIRKFRHSESEKLNCKEHIMYLKQNNVAKLMDVLFEIIDYKLQKEIDPYIFLFHINKILYICSQDPITSISYFDNSKLKINDGIYKIS